MEVVWTNSPEMVCHSGRALLEVLQLPDLSVDFNLQGKINIYIFQKCKLILASLFTVWFMRFNLIHSLYFETLQYFMNIIFSEDLQDLLSEYTHICMHIFVNLRLKIVEKLCAFLILPQ